MYRFEVTILFQVAFYSKSPSYQISRKITRRPFIWSCFLIREIRVDFRFKSSTLVKLVHQCHLFFFNEKWSLLVSTLFRGCHWEVILNKMAAYSQLLELDLSQFQDSAWSQDNRIAVTSGNMLYILVSDILDWFSLSRSRRCMSSHPKQASGCSKAPGLVVDFI